MRKTLIFHLHHTTTAAGAKKLTDAVANTVTVIPVGTAHGQRLEPSDSSPDAHVPFVGVGSTSFVSPSTTTFRDS